VLERIYLNFQKEVHQYFYLRGETGSMMKYDWDKEHWENTKHLDDGTILKAYVQVKLEK
jgi:hypothetical protein